MLCEHILIVAQFVVAVEYIDCISARPLSSTTSALHSN